jgi:acyl-CoA thioesterase
VNPSKLANHGRGPRGILSQVGAVPSFDEATRVILRAPGRYDTYIHPAWDGRGVPNGGILAASLLRAARGQLARADLPPRTLSVHFPRPAVNGAAQIIVEVLREEGSTARVRSELFQHGKLVCTALLTFSSVRDETLPIADTAPVVPPWQEVDSFDCDGAPETPPCLHRIEPRPCLGQTPFSPATETLTGGWMQLRGDTADVDAERLVALSDMWWPVVVAVNDIVRTPTLELCHFRSTTAVKAPVLGQFSTTTVREHHLDETAQLWSQDGTLLAETRQLAVLIRPPG